MLPDKKVFKMIFRKSAIVWQRSWSLVLNIFRDSCFGIGHFQAVLLIKVLLIKKKRVAKVPHNSGRKLAKM